MLAKSTIYCFGLMTSFVFTQQDSNSVLIPSYVPNLIFMSRSSNDSAFPFLLAPKLMTLRV